MAFTGYTLDEYSSRLCRVIYNCLKKQHENAENSNETTERKVKS